MRYSWEMKALAWHGKRAVRIDDVPDPKIRGPTDAVIRVTITAICGSDLDLYELPLVSDRIAELAEGEDG